VPRGFRSKQARVARSDVDLSAVSFEREGWVEEERESNWLLWRNAHGDVLALTQTRSIDSHPLSDFTTLLSAVRSTAEDDGGAIVSTVMLFDHHRSAAQSIYKKRQDTGFVYFGMYEVAIGDVRVVLTCVCGERGMTGAREAVVANTLLSAGKLRLPSRSEPDESIGPRNVEGWFEDPYDLDYAGPVLRNLSDDERYDTVIPDHPLTRLRETLAMLRHTLSLPS